MDFENSKNAESKDFAHNNNNTLKWAIPQEKQDQGKSTCYIF